MTARDDDGPNGPNFRVLTWAVGVTWAFSTIAAAVAVLRAEWAGLLPAANAAVAAAGWYLTARRWEADRARLLRD